MNPLADAVFDNVSFTGQIGPPTQTYNALSAPSDLTVNRGNGAELVATWNSVSGATDGYLLERSADNVDWTNVNTTFNTTFNDFGISGSQRWFYRVSSLNSFGASSSISLG